MLYFVLPSLMFNILKNVSFRRLITPVGEGRLFFCYRLVVILLFLFERVSSSSKYLGNAALFYCGTPCS